jgi:hypothetical protein
MTKLIKNTFAIVLISFGAFGILQKQLHFVIDPTIEINIDRPSDSILEKVTEISDLITDKNDRLKVGIFNKQFAERITKYNTDVQQVNDVYTLAGQQYFSDTLKGKYDNLGKKVSGLISSITTEDNHLLTTEEKKELSETFTGLAWALIKKR